MKPFLLFGLALLLSACGAPPSSTPFPTPEAINLYFPVALKPWADKLGACASSTPLVALYDMPASTSKSGLSANEIALTLGSPSQDDQSNDLWQVGWEQIVVIVNQGNDLSGLTLNEVRSIFTGQTQVWTGTTDQRIQVWMPPDGDPTRILFDQAVIPSRTLTSEAMLAPDPTAMLEAVSQDVTAIGYLPKSIITSTNPAQTAEVKIIPIEGSPDELKQPVIAKTQTEPVGLMRDLLICLQNTSH